MYGNTIVGIKTINKIYFSRNLFFLTFVQFDTVKNGTGTSYRWLPSQKKHC
jgi:hypothetical protein